MDVAAIAARFRVSERTARGWVRDWHAKQGDGVPVVALVPPASGRGRTRYVVDAASLDARFAVPALG